MQSEKPDIKIFSPAFHLSVFLPFLFRTITFQENQPAPHIRGVPYETTILTIIAMSCMVIGFVNIQVLVGLMAGLLGGCIFLLLLASSLLSQRRTGYEPTWASFRPTPFLFVMLAGMTIGLVVTQSFSEAGIGMKAVGAGFGLLIGYSMGVWAGFWFQALGWIHTIIEIVLIPLMIGLMIVSVVMAIA